MQPASVLLQLFGVALLVGATLGSPLRPQPPRDWIPPSGGSSRSDSSGSGSGGRSVSTSTSTYHFAGCPGEPEWANVFPDIAWTYSSTTGAGVLRWTLTSRTPSDLLYLRRMPFRLRGSTSSTPPLFTSEVLLCSNAYPGPSCYTQIQESQPPQLVGSVDFGVPLALLRRFEQGGRVELEFYEVQGRWAGHLCGVLSS